MTATLGTDTASELLAVARDVRRAELAAGADLLQHAAEWAAMHPAESILDSARAVGSEDEVAIAGDGAPLVAEFCVAEFAAAVGMTPDGGRRFLGQAVELRYRLPRCWARVVAGDLPAWKARSIADHTLSLSEETARYVDRHVAAFAHSIGPVQLGRLVDEAIARHQPDLAEEKRKQAAEHRYFDIDLHLAGTAGTIPISGCLDVADAIDLETAVASTARELASLGSTDSVDVRRSVALGEIARRDLTLFHADQPSGQPPPATRTVVLHVHLSDAALQGDEGGHTVGRCEETGTPVLATQVRGWCETAGKIVVKPVIDLADCLPVDSYEIPDRIKERVRLRDHHCAFPACQRRAEACDCDHIQPHARGGPTCPCNLAALCRRHHRLKTFTAWTYTMVEPGTYLWRSPHGYHYQVDPSGTVSLDP